MPRSDHAGNLLTKATGGTVSAQYTYNADNQLTGVQNGTTRYAYTYHPNGLRKTKAAYNASNVLQNSTTYTWSGDALVMETVGSTNKRYFYGLDLVAGTSGTTATTNYFTHDAHGSVALTTNTSGAAVRPYEYDAFGNLLNAASSDSNPFRYSGEYFDSETGNYYLRARYYDPGIGRFTQQDTYRGETNNPISLNYYVYCYNDPVKFVDSSGNIPVETIADLINIGWSLYDFYHNPTVLNALLLLWDVAATALPYIPASYAAKGVKAVARLDDAADVTRAISKADDVADATKYVDEVASGGKTWAEYKATNPIKNNPRAIGHAFEQWYYEAYDIVNKQVVHSGYRFDAIKDGQIIELKNYNWDKYSSYGGLASKFRKQASNYTTFIGDTIRDELNEGVTFVFSSRPPDEIERVLKELGVAVKWID